MDRRAGKPSPLVLAAFSLSLFACARGEIEATSGTPVPVPQPSNPDDFDPIPSNTGGRAGSPAENNAGRAGSSSQAGGSGTPAADAGPGPGAAGMMGTAGAPGRDAGVSPSADAAPATTPDAAAPLPPLPGGPCDLAIADVAVYQGPKITLARDGAVVATAMRNASVIQKRIAFFRAYVRPGAGFAGKEADLRLVLKSAAGEKTYTDRKAVKAASDEATLATTFNFTVPAADIAADTSWAVEVASCTSSAGGRVPATGDAKLDAIRTGTLKVKLVPIKYDADNSGRLPDTSEAQIKKFKDYVQAMYPIETIDISVRAAVSSTIALTDSNNWPKTLDQMRTLRAQDAPASDIYYYGLVNPAATGQEYCKGSCVAGIAYKVPTGNNAASQRAGLGLGFVGNSSLETLAHEVGHEHGRAHAPCGNVAGADTAFPGGKGEMLVNAYNTVTNVLITATGRKDIMGYCSPKWISDYTYEGLAQRSKLVNGTAVQAFEIGGGRAQKFRVMLVDGAGGAEWGQPWVAPATEGPFGEPETAEALDDAGRVVTQVTVFRSELPDFDGHATVLVPEPQAGWAQIRVGGAQALSFAAPIAVPPLR